jgi:hypothetical protein
VRHVRSMGSCYPVALAILKGGCLLHLILVRGHLERHSYTPGRTRRTSRGWIGIRSPRWCRWHHMAGWLSLRQRCKRSWRPSIGICMSSCTQLYCVQVRRSKIPLENTRRQDTIGLVERKPDCRALCHIVSFHNVMEIMF